MNKFERQEEYYVRRMQRHGVEWNIFTIVKLLHSWEEGITRENLLKEIKRLRKKNISEIRVAMAISMHKKFGKLFGFYIQSDFGWVISNDKKQRKWRYFCPREPEDINRERNKLKN